MRSGVPKHFLGYILSGHARVVAENIKIEMDAGDLFYIPKGLEYQSYWDPDEVVSWYSFGFEILPDAEDRLFSLQKLPYGDDEKALIDKIANEKSCITIGYLFELLGMLLPKMCTCDGRKMVSTVEMLLRTEPRCSVEALAKKCKMSVSGFYSAFRREAGKTPNEFRKEILVQCAEELLQTTDMPVEEISAVLGFSSSSYFRKVLREKAGKTPRDIRKKSRV